MTHLSRTTTIAIALTAALGAPTVHAADAPAASSEQAGLPLPNQRIGPRVVLPEPPVPAGRNRLLSGTGHWLDERGITPRLSATYMYFGNPSMGLTTDRELSVGMFAVGGDFDLGKIAGLRGSAVHFTQLFVPHNSNLRWGPEVGDPLVGKPGPYTPRVSHLTLLTYEQKLLNDKLALEVGKSNASNYFAKPACNVAVACNNPILMEEAGFNPPPYAHWSARASYDLSPALRVQAGAWRRNAAYPFTDGWERRGGKVGGNSTLSSMYVANIAYATDDRMERYPRSYEALVYYNNGTQVNPESGATSDGTSGFYLGAKQTFWKAESGPAKLAAWGNLTRNFNPGSTAGFGTLGRAGLSLTGPWRSRPFDSYGISLGWIQLTQAKQRQIVNNYEAVAGRPYYGVGRNEYSLGFDAVFVLDRGVIVAPYATRVWNANGYLETTTGNTTTGRTPRDGWAVGLLVHVQLDAWLGLSGR